MKYHIGFLIIFLIIFLSINNVFAIDGNNSFNSENIEVNKIYSTYFGGTGDDKAYNLVTDSQGNIYIAMDTNSPNLYTSSNAYQKNIKGGTDIYITKFSSTGERVYSTYFGGSGIDRVKDFTVDDKGNIYFTGYTLSNNFPLTENALSKNFNGVEDAYISVLNPTGTDIIYSSYIKGSLDDRAYGIVTDNNFNVYIVGYTNSLDFQVTDNAYQKFKKGTVWVKDSPYDALYQNSLDCFILEVNIESGNLIYSTYFGGSGTDYSYGAIGIDYNGIIYISGATESLDIPTTDNAYSKYSSGGYDYFLLALKGNNLIYSTYIGGRYADEPHEIIIKNNSLYLLGDTMSDNFPTTDNAYKKVMCENDTMDGSLIKFDLNSWDLIFSTLLGGSKDEDLTRMAIDDYGNIYVTGFTVSTDFPVTENALQKNKRGYEFLYSSVSDDNDNFCYDAIISKFDALGEKLLYSTYYGGSSGEYGQGIILLENGFIVSMQVWSDDLDVSNNAIQRFHSNDKTNSSLLGRKNLYKSDMYFVKFNENLAKNLTKLVNTNFNKFFNESKNFTGKLFTIDNVPISGAHLNLKLTRLSSNISKVYGVVTDYNGVYSLPINLSPGNYLVEVDYFGSVVFKSSYSCVSLKVFDFLDNLTFIEAKSLTKLYGTDGKFELKLFDVNFNPLKRSFINLNIVRLSSGCSKVYSLSTDDMGCLEFDISLAKGIYMVHCSYDGMNYYINSSCDTSILIL